MWADVNFQMKYRRYSRLLEAGKDEDYEQMKSLILLDYMNTEHYPQFPYASKYVEPVVSVEVITSYYRKPHAFSSSFSFYFLFFSIWLSDTPCDGLGIRPVEKKDSEDAWIPSKFIFDKSQSMPSFRKKLIVHPYKFIL